MAGHTLVVMRHAKSAWPEGVADLARPLNERGRRDAPAAGRWLRSQVPDIDMTLVSTATRTRQTWDLVAEELGGDPDCLFDDRIYDGSPDALLAAVRELPETARTVLLLGHNPGVTELVRVLTGDGVELRTSSVAVVGGPDRWAEFGQVRAELALFETPRG